MVLEVRVREGDRVGTGQLLIQLSDGEARAALQQAQAARRKPAAVPSSRLGGGADGNQR